MSTLQPSHGPSGPARPQPAESTVSYVLVHSGSDPARPSAPTASAPTSSGRAPSVPGLGLCGPGWTVLAAHGSRWSWSIRLDAHGAAYAAPTRVAQAVAVRVLSVHGIEVLGWNPADPEARAYAAITVAPQVLVQRRASKRWWR
jgi:hypothetical protein